MPYFHCWHIQKWIESVHSCTAYRTEQNHSGQVLVFTMWSQNLCSCLWFSTVANVPLTNFKVDDELLIKNCLAFRSHSQSFILIFPTAVEAMGPFRGTLNWYIPAFWWVFAETKSCTIENATREVRGKQSEKHFTHLSAWDVFCITILIEKQHI